MAKESGVPGRIRAAQALRNWRAASRTNLVRAASDDELVLRQPAGDLGLSRAALPILASRRSTVLSFAVSTTPTKFLR